MRSPRLASLVLLSLAVVAQLAAAERPNVLFIVADDQNCALGCYGNSTIKTPNLDRLASLGVRFDRAYCNYPVCNASRASFLSGRRPDTTGVFGNATNPRTKLGDEFQFLPEYFKSHGYFTAGIGKISHPAFADQIGWDVQSDPQVDRQEEIVKLAKKERKRQNKNGPVDQTVPVPFEWHATDYDDSEEPDGITARKVAQLLEEHRDGPFFVAAGFHKPHLSHTAPKKYFAMYPPDRMPLPAAPAGHEKQIPAIATPPKYYPELTDEQRRHIIAHYYAASTFMDAQVGVLLEALDRLKLWDNTIVVFIGDHGWHLGEHGGFWAKQSLMKESARSPLIVVAPGKARGAACARVVEYIDLFPTLAEFCGLPPQPGLEGNSILPLVADPQHSWSPAVYSVVTRPAGGKRKAILGRGVYSERWTYIAWPDGSEQLYDYAADPHEYHNLAGGSEYASVKAEMRALLEQAPHSTTLE